MLQEIADILRAQLRPPRLKRIAVFKNIEANGSAHSAGDIINETDTDGAATPWILKNAARINGGSGYITKAQVVIEPESQTFRTALQIYNRYPTCEMDDNAAAASPNAADMPFFEDEILVPALHSRGDSSYSVATPGTGGNLPLAFTCAPGSRDLYIIPIAVEATTFTAGELMYIIFEIDQYQELQMFSSQLLKPYMPRNPLRLRFHPDANTVLWLPGQDDPQSSTIRDRSGNNNHGTIIGATWKQTGQGFWYPDFDGTDDKITIATSTELDAVTFTIEMWVNVLSSTGNYMLIHKRDGTTKGWSLEFRGDLNKHLALFVCNGGTWTILDSNINAITTASVWYHVMVSYTAADKTARFYINGNAHGSEAWATALAAPTGIGMEIGEYSGGQDFAGGIALPRMYNVAKTTGYYQEERHYFGV